MPFLPAPRALRDERGFTMMELLVVLVIIGTLAAIALPVFASQKNTAHDADAKSRVGDMATQMELCAVEDESYEGCSPTGVVDETDGNDKGNGKGKGKGNGKALGLLKQRSERGYEVEATSVSGITFTVTRSSSGLSRTCRPSGQRGCQSGTW